ncbi:hypothetical protein AB0F30_21385 [Streptomyces sp. NPDC029006]|uniref:hypothetical protein n=1 Tax=Streptomyces sp. NPDC029006 TaxID=3155467 RepID=UPI0033CA0EF7
MEVGYGRWEWGRFPVVGTPYRDEVPLSGRLADAVSPVVLAEVAELPDLRRPPDRAWCLGGDADLVSTYVAGSPELLAERLPTPGLEAHPVRPDDLLG